MTRATPISAPRVSPKASAAPAATSSAATPVLPEPPKFLAILPEVEAWLAEQHASSKTPGFAVGIVSRNELVFSKGFGVRDLRASGAVDENTTFRIGSITKVFTALAVLKLSADGLLDMDAPAERYVPALANVIYPQGHSEQISVRQLVTHASGLPRNAKPLTRTADADFERKLLASLNGLKLEYAPGTEFRYSNLGFQLLGLIVGKCAKVSLQEYLKSLIFDPLAMHHTAWNASELSDSLATGYVNVEKEPKPTPLKHFGPADGDGGLYSSVADLARFAIFELSAAHASAAASPVAIPFATIRDSQQIILSGTARLTRTALTPATAPDKYVGFYWLIQKDAGFEHLVFHSGVVSGYRSSIGLLPEHGIAVITLTNSDALDTETVMRDVAQKLLKAAI